MLARLFSALLLALLPLAVEAQRADRPAPFETLAFTVSGQLDLGGGLDDSGYHASWTPGPGLALRASTPFYLGQAHAGLQFALHDGADPLPGYLAMLGYGGIGPRLSLPLGVEVEPALIAGILSMDFYEDKNIAPAGRRESEFVLGASADLSVPLSARLRAVAGVQAFQVYTNPRFRLGSASAGLRWTMDTPGWLRRELE